MDATSALKAGLPVLLPTDTVYGLASAPDEEAATRLYALKGRGRTQPTAILAATVEGLLAAVPELDEPRLRRLLPGPFTLVVPNPAGRFPWLTGGQPGPIGVRVPTLPVRTSEIVAAVGVVLATSANDPGGPNPTTLDDVPPRIRAGCAAELDLGALPGRPSTVIDLTHEEPRILREGAVPAAEALRRLRA
ncbi:MAG TPA: L-threonylcarbamoyladenylate synthase [Gaiellaceae bacterium]|nr:L-threonylcarbamoyladenylate synthase [Gaiellaceae bacterium]